PRPWRDARGSIRGLQPDEPLQRCRCEQRLGARRRAAAHFHAADQRGASPPVPGGGAGYVLMAVAGTAESGGVRRRDFLRATTMAAAGAVVARRPLFGQERAITVVAGGDAIITRPLRGLTEPPVTALLDLFRGADVGFFNCEMTFHDLEGYPAATGACGDLNLIADPRIVDDLRWGGFNLTSLANNHTVDYGHGGLLA